MGETVKVEGLSTRGMEQLKINTHVMVQFLETDFSVTSGSHFHRLLSSTLGLMKL